MLPFREFAPHGTTTKRHQIPHGSLDTPAAQTIATAEREDPSLVNKAVIFSYSGCRYSRLGATQSCVWCGKCCSFANSRLQTRPQSRKEKPADYSRVRGAHMTQNIAEAEPKRVRILRTTDFLSHFGGQLLTVRGTRSRLLTVSG